jgi:hypothetical protein
MGFSSKKEAGPSTQSADLFSALSSRRLIRSGTTKRRTVVFLTATTTAFNLQEPLKTSVFKSGVSCRFLSPGKKLHLCNWTCSITGTKGSLLVISQVVLSGCCLKTEVFKQLYSFYNGLIQ